MNQSLHGAKVLEPSSAPEPQQPPAPSPSEPGRTGRAAAFIGWLVRAVPTAVVLAALGGLAYWGHHTGWTIPKFSELTGHGEAEERDWCKEHSVPESECVECNPKLLPKPKKYGWSEKFGVHDNPLEHPDIAQMKTPPQVSPADLELAQRALEFAERTENNRKCSLHPRRIQFVSQEAVEKAGLDFAVAWKAPLEEIVTASGSELTYDPDRVAPLASPVPGRVWRVLKGIGEAVKKDDVLALVDAAEVGKAKAEFRQALVQVDVETQNVERQRPLKGAAVSGAQFLKAEADLRAAEIRLGNAEQALANLGLAIRAKDVKELSAEALGRHMRFLGFTAPALKALGAEVTADNLLPVKAPFDGVVVDRNAARGVVVDASKTLFVVADPSHLWLTLSVRQEDLKPFREKDPKRLLTGKPVRFVPDGTSEQVGGTITWVSTAVDEKNRTLHVRADLVNPEGRLRAHTFGKGEIILRAEKDAVVVPSEAVHWDEACHVVFVQDKNFYGEGGFKVFHVRSVRPGAKYRGNTEIIAGVLPGEAVVTRGSAVLRAELLKGNLGEG